jgi:hypothetical protein
VALFAVVVLVNMCALAMLETNGSLQKERVLDVVSAHIFAAVLIRNEYFIYFHLGLCTAVPLSTPLFFRKLLADAHHFGGVHSGCAVSALMWYLAYIIHSTLDFLQSGVERVVQWVDIVACYLFLAILLLICTTSLPAYRRTHHNVFEKTHRFGGWTALATLWIHAILSSVCTAQTSAFQKQPSAYFLILTTVLLIHPWLRLQKIRVSSHWLSPRELMLTFDYKDMPHMSTMRFSRRASPLGSEWHQFATIPSEAGQTASIIVAEAGDWTRTIIQNPPTDLWIRKPPTRNFLMGIRMFRRVLLVATGAGIGPCLSCLSSLTDEQRKDRVVKVLWSANRPFTAAWAFAVHSIRRVDPSPMIVDSGDGRLDLVFDVRRLAEEYLVDAVFVVSRMQLTDRIVADLRCRGVAAYGAVFDS